MTTGIRKLSDNITKLRKAQEMILAMANHSGDLQEEADPILAILSEVQEDTQYERAARETLHWWADTIRTCQDGEIKGRLVDGMKRIVNLDTITNPQSFPAGMVRIAEEDDEQRSAEIRLTGVIKTLEPGDHFLYLSIDAAAQGETTDLWDKERSHG